MIHYYVIEQTHIKDVTLLLSRLTSLHSQRSIKLLICCFV